MNQPVNADDVINSLAQRLANLIVEGAIKDARIAALTAELEAKESESASTGELQLSENDEAYRDISGSDTGPLSAVG